MWAALVLVLQDIPIIGKGVQSIIGLLTKPPAEQEQEVSTQIQSDENSLDKTGRPE